MYKSHPTLKTELTSYHSNDSCMFTIFWISSIAKHVKFLSVLQSAARPNRSSGLDPQVNLSFSLIHFSN